jgi:hypothetical protein
LEVDWVLKNYIVQDNIAEEHTAERERITWKQQWLHWGWEQQHINGKKSSTLYIVLIYAANQYCNQAAASCQLDVYTQHSISKLKIHLELCRRYFSSIRV